MPPSLSVVQKLTKSAPQDERVFEPPRPSTEGDFVCARPLRRRFRDRVALELIPQPELPFQKTVKHLLVVCGFPANAIHQECIYDECVLMSLAGAHPVRSKCEPESRSSLLRRSYRSCH